MKTEKAVNLMLPIIIFLLSYKDNYSYKVASEYKVSISFEWYQEIPWWDKVSVLGQAK